MEYCIVNKIEDVGGEVVYTPIGYLSNQTDCEAINEKHDSTFGAWVETNKEDLELGEISISVFFDSTPIIYVARTTVNYLDGFTEITDITEMV